MVHNHTILDLDKHFVIDPVTRKILPEVPEKKKLMQHDHNSERYTFEIPRYIEGHDMGLCDVIQIHYLNISANGRKTNNGIYEVKDISNTEDDVAFSWLISENATQLEGTLNFSIRFICMENAEIIYAWNTDVHTGILISNSINNTEVIIHRYADVLEEWRKKILIDPSENIKQAVSDYIEENCMSIWPMSTYVTPEMYGAVGDGIHDDAPALQAALESGKPVVLTQDLYLFSGIWVKDHDVVLDGRGHTLHVDAKDQDFQTYHNGYIRFSATTVKRTTNEFDPNSGCELAIVSETPPFWARYHRGYVSYRGSNPTPGNEVYEEFTVRYCREHTADIRNLKITCRNCDGFRMLELAAMCNSTIDNVSVVCEDGHDGALGIATQNCYHVRINNCYVRNWTANNTRHVSSEGYGIQFDGDDIAITNCTAIDCKHCLTGGTSVVIFSTNILIDNCVLRQDHYDHYAFSSQGEDGKTYQQVFDIHAACIAPIINNLKIMTSNVVLGNGCYAIGLRCNKATFTNIHIDSFYTQLYFAEVCEEVTFTNLQAPGACLNFDDVKDGFLKKVEIIGGQFRRIEKAKFPAKLYLQNVTINEYIDNISYLVARGCTFAREMQWASKPTLTLLGESILTDCIIYGHKDDWIGKTYAIIKAPKNTVHMRDSKIYKRLGDDYKTFSTDQADVSGCWYEDVFGFYLDGGLYYGNQSILGKNNLF